MMKTSLRSGTAVLVLLVAAAAAGAGEPSPVATESDLVYSRVGEVELRLDLARPSDGAGPFPAVLLIHGGAWRAGKKDDLRGALGEFARRGYVAASPQYRLCPKATFPAQVHDVKAAVRWLRAHAREHKVDPDHIGAMGFSAGGHLALMLGVTAPADGLEGDGADGPSTRVQAVVNYFGPTDLAADDLPDVSREIVKDFLGGSARDLPEAAAKASPLTFVTKDDPPILTFQGTRDPLVPYTQATRLTVAMTAAGVPGRVELLVGEAHGWTGKDLERTRDEAFAFFDRYLKPTGP